MVRYTIGAKLVTIMGLLLLSSLLGINTLVTYFVSKDVQRTAEENNFTSNRAAVSLAEMRFSTLKTETAIFLSGAANGQQNAEFFFANNTNIAAILVPEQIEFVNAAFANDANSTETPFRISDFSTLASYNYIEAARRGTTSLENVSQKALAPLIALYAPFGMSGMVIFFSPDILQDAFSANTASNTFLINMQNQIIIHSDKAAVLEAKNMTDDTFVRIIHERITANKTLLHLQERYTETDEKNYFGTFTILNEIGYVITIIPEDLVFDGVNQTSRRNLYLTAAVLFLALFFLWLFSLSITTPIKRLISDGTEEIEKGHFHVALPQKTNDEIGDLTKSIVEMGNRLAERENLKSSFKKFVGADEFVNQAMAGTIKLGGEIRTLSVMFTDIRSFTSMTENMSGNDTIGFLNSYLRIMVRAITTTDGMVDKFMGDGIMAMWGMPFSQGNTETNACKAVACALKMRYALGRLNKTRGTPERPIIKIGIGINTGASALGQVGSEERMEYTAIGDAINTASRTEGLNKVFGTDILITDNTYKFVKNRFITEPMKVAAVKGKEDLLQTYAVLGMARKRN
ncbi:MAG: adenylate/guanylate cyclase domain-containing protein [Treponemataceae bacterium]|nr:MAG: adenylate/guanylate cyclase domain-containing protein [Treponemataceae bacterium]